MASKLHTLIDIFNTEFIVDDEKVKLKQIIIPIIQRDYAQGRTDSDTKRVRERFLEALYDAVTDKSITLDFVYGDIDKNGVMTPLDGQQRLTTLFLLHWYAAQKADIPYNEYMFLKKFSYETRYSARNFCINLIENYKPSFTKKISDEIIDQPWFPLDWKKDATIASMLVMLDAIDEKFKDIGILWDQLTNDAISFYFLPIKNMGLTDELYIKMNSRGKPLTQFEHFKAELERELRKYDTEIATDIIKKIDIDWTDMLWCYRSDDNIIDDEFLRYFRFITDILCYKSGGTTQGKNSDEFDLIKEYFSTNTKDIAENINFMDDYYRVWCEVSKKQTLKEFFEQYISFEHVLGKIKIDNKLDLFEDCLRNYADVLGNGNRTFPLNRLVLLYAIITYLLNKQSIPDDLFRRRLRVVHNLVRNSEFELSDSETRSAGNRMPAILRQVDSIMINGVINDNDTPNFNSFQLEEEKKKLVWVKEHTEYAENLYKLEDHRLLRGQISIIGLEQIENFDKFEKLFKCNWDLVDCALMTMGDYKQCERNGWRHQLGSHNFDKAWINLFHSSSNRGFNDTKAVLTRLLMVLDDISEEKLKELVKNFVNECEKKSEFPWRYYYIKYSDFRPGRYGKVSWENLDLGFYDMHILWTESKWSENSYNPFLKAAAPKYINRDELGHYLLLDEMDVSCENCGFIFYKQGTDEEVSRIEIEQTENGIDKEDRVKILKKYIYKYEESKN